MSETYLAARRYFTVFFYLFTCRQQLCKRMCMIPRRGRYVFFVYLDYGDAFVLSRLIISIVDHSPLVVCNILFNIVGYF